MTKDLNFSEQWVDLYADSLYSYALKFIPHIDQAQNLVQETFLAALQGKANFKSNSSEKTWLIGILKHKITDYLRLKYRETPVSQMVTDDMHIEQFFDNAADGHLKIEPKNWSYNPASLIENKEFWIAFNNCLGKLPEKAGQAFSLSELEEMKSDEICKVLRISSTNLWVLLHRARLQLRICLEKNWFKEPHE